jgi:hypothetical protein
MVLDSALFLDDPVAVSASLTDWLGIDIDPAKAASATPTDPNRF